MVEVGKGFGVPRQIERTPNLYDKVAAVALKHGFRLVIVDEEDVIPSLALAPAGYAVLISGKEFEEYFPELAQIDGTGRTHMKDIANLKDGFSLWEKKLKDGSSKTLFMAAREHKSGSANLRANGMLLTMPQTPITGRSLANPMEDFDLYLDSGASQNVVHNPALLINPRDPPAGMDQFIAADGSPMDVIRYGDIEMENFRIPDVCLVNGLTVNLISVGQLAKSHKIRHCFAGNECNLMLSDGRRIGGAIRLDNNQYILRFLEIQ